MELKTQKKKTTFAPFFLSNTKSVNGFMTHERLRFFSRKQNIIFFTLHKTSCS